jgi:hypothetical protein
MCRRPSCTTSARELWGTYLDGQTVSGMWSSTLQKDHINLLEMRAVLFFLISNFVESLSIVLTTDNTSLKWERTERPSFPKDWCDLSEGWKTTSLKQFDRPDKFPIPEGKHLWIGSDWELQMPGKPRKITSIFWKWGPFCSFSFQTLSSPYLLSWQQTTQQW